MVWLRLGCRWQSLGERGPENEDHGPRRRLLEGVELALQEGSALPKPVEKRGRVGRNGRIRVRFNFRRQFDSRTAAVEPIWAAGGASSLFL